MSNKSLFAPLDKLMLSKRTLNSIVAFSEQSQFTWQDFCSDVAKLVLYLEQIKAKDFAICSADSYLFSVAFLASLHAKKQVILPGCYQAGVIEELADNFSYIITDGAIELPSSIEQIDLNRLSWRNCNVKELGLLDLVAAEIVMFTSGSSGRPKPIYKNGLHLSLEIEQLEQLFGDICQDKLVYSTVSHQHIYGLQLRLLWPLCTGNAFSQFNLDYPEQIFATSSSKTILISSPALLKRLDNIKNKKIDIAAIFSAGGPLNDKAISDVELIFGKFINEIYGTTETGAIAYRKTTSLDKNWTLFPNLNATLNKNGCLTLVGEHISNSFYQSADACIMDGERNFKLLGRTDRIIKIEEKRVSLVNVEARLAANDWIDEVAIIPLSRANRVELGAVVTLSHFGLDNLEKLGKAQLVLALRASLRTWLEPVAIPRRFRIVSHIPVNTQGKRLKSILDKLFE